MMMLSQADRHFSLNNVGSKVPPLLDLELNTDCNGSCIKCFQSFAKPKAEIMDWELAKNIIAQFAKGNGKSLKLIYRGEPLLHIALLLKTIRLSKSLGIVRVVINTNGMLLNGKTARSLIESGLDQISISVDACTPETYSLLHGQDIFLRVKKNIVGLQLIKKTILHKKTPMVVIHGVRQEGNKREIDSGDYERFWIKLGDDVEIRDFLDLEDWSDDKRKCREFCCKELWERMVVLVNGDVIPCCSGYDYVQEKAYKIGNITTSTLEDLWKGNTLKTMRLLHKQGKSHKIKLCRTCRGRKHFIDEVEKK